MKQNRPYSANDIFTNLHGTVAKTAVGKALSSLATKNKINSKVFGKSTIFFAKQDMEILSVEQMSTMESEIQVMRQSIDKLKNILKENQKQLKELNSTVTTMEALEQIPIHEQQNLELNERLSLLADGELIDPKLKAKTEQDYKDARKLWVQRRRAFNGVIDMIMENMDRKKEEFLEELGVETDQMVNLSLDKY